MTISEALEKIEVICRDNQYMVAAGYNPSRGKLMIGIGAGMAPEIQVEGESLEKGLIELATQLEQ